MTEPTISPEALAAARKALAEKRGSIGIGIFFKEYFVFVLCAGVLAGLVVAESAIGTHEKGAMLHTVERLVDAAIGGAAAIMFMAFVLGVAREVVAPNLNEASELMQRASRGEKIDEAASLMAAGVFVGAGLRLLALMLPLTVFGILL